MNLQTNEAERESLSQIDHYLYLKDCLDYYLLTF